MKGLGRIVILLVLILPVATCVGVSALSHLTGY